MTTRQFEVDRLAQAVGDAGGPVSVCRRLRERFSLTADAARKRLSRALAEVAMGRELCESVLLAANIPSHEHEAYLRPLATGGHGELSTGGDTAATRAFGVHAEIDPLAGGREDEQPDGRVVFLGGCQALLALTNSSARPLSVTGVRLNVGWEPVPRRRYARGERAVGDAVVPHQLFVELFRDGRYSGWWRFAAGARLATEPVPFDSDSTQLLEAKDGGRSILRIPPGDTEWIQASFMPRDEGLFTITVAAVAANAEMQKSAKRTAEFRVALGETDDAGQ